MSARPLPLTLALLLSTALAGAQEFQMPKVEVESDAKTDFSTFKTFRWKDSQEPAENQVVHTSVLVYVDRGLAAKGLAKKTEGSVDLLVRYFTSSEESLKGVGSQSALPTSGGNPGDSATRIDVKKQATGRLVLELYRASDGVLVWKGSTVSPSVDKKRLDTEVSIAVKRLLAKYPPKPAVK